MKKLFSIALLVSLAVAVSAQNLTFRQNDFRATYNGVAGDTLSSARTLAKTVYVDKDYFYHVNVQVEADSAGDATNVTAKLQGSWDNTTFYDIGSATTWAISAADTVFSLNSFATTETESRAAFNVVGNGDSISVSDTLAYAAQTVTITKNVSGIVYPYLRVLFTGAAAGSDMVLTKLRFRIIKAN